MLIASEYFFKNLVRKLFGAIDSVNFNVLNMSSTSLDDSGVKRKVLSDGLIIFVVFTCGDFNFWGNYCETLVEEIA